MCIVFDVIISRRWGEFYDPPNISDALIYMYMYTLWYYVPVHLTPLKQLGQRNRQWYRSEFHAKAIIRLQIMVYKWTSYVFYAMIYITYQSRLEEVFYNDRVRRKTLFWDSYMYLILPRLYRYSELHANKGNHQTK